MDEVLEKRYRCARCGHISKQTTNHYGNTWSWGHVNTCPECPPWAKYPEFGGRTLWMCLDKPALKGGRDVLGKAEGCKV